MPLKIIHPHHTEVIGKGLVLLFNPHVKGPRRDLYTGQIVEEAALLSRSWAIIAKESKHDQEEDNPRPAKSDFDGSVQAFVEEYGIKCVMVITGMSEPGITIKGRQDDSQSEEILEIIRTGLEPHFSINSTPEQVGNGPTNSPAVSQGTQDAPTHSVLTVQLELGPDERGLLKDQIVGSIADIVGLINARLGFSDSNERGSGVLD